MSQENSWQEKSSEVSHTSTPASLLDGMLGVLQDLLILSEEENFTVDDLRTHVQYLASRTSGRFQALKKNEDLLEALGLEPCGDWTMHIQKPSTCGRCDSSAGLSDKTYWICQVHDIRVDSDLEPTSCRIFDKTLAVAHAAIDFDRSTTAGTLFEDPVPDSDAATSLGLDALVERIRVLEKLTLGGLDNREYSDFREVLRQQVEDSGDEVSEADETVASRSRFSFPGSVASKTRLQELLEAFRDLFPSVRDYHGRIVLSGDLSHLEWVELQHQVHDLLDSIEGVLLDDDEATYLNLNGSNVEEAFLDDGEHYYCPACSSDAGTWFDRVLCPPPCKLMHDRCVACGWAQGCKNEKGGENGDGSASTSGNCSCFVCVSNRFPSQACEPEVILYDLIEDLQNLDSYGSDSLGQVVLEYGVVDALGKAQHRLKTLKNPGGFKGGNLNEGEGFSPGHHADPGDQVPSDKTHESGVHEDRTVENRVTSDCKKHEVSYPVGPIRILQDLIAELREMAADTTIPVSSQLVMLETKYAETRLKETTEVHVLRDLVAQLRDEHPCRDRKYCDRCVDQWRGSLLYPCPTLTALDRAEQLLKGLSNDSNI